MNEKAYKEMVEEIDQSDLNLYGWDLQFISDLIDNPPRHYSEKQRKHIERIHERIG